MKRKAEMRDERVLSQQRRIVSEGFYILLVFLFASMLYKQLILDAPVSAYLTELLGALGACLYIVVRCVFAGVLYAGKQPTNKRFYATSLFVGVIVAGVTALRTFRYYSSVQDAALGLGITLISGAVTCLIVNFAIEFFGKRRLKQLEKQLDAEDDDEA